jgi:DNA-binding GntR family transcriptional regulator
MTSSTEQAEHQGDSGGPDRDLGSAGQLQRPEPLAEQAFRALREEIATGALVPGQRITERALAMRLGVSPTPVREALRRLEQEGLVEHSGARTLSVVAHSDEALQELMYAEVVLRAAEARSAAKKITDEQLLRLDSIVSEMLQRVGTATDDELLILGKQFDGVVTEAAASPGVHRLIDSASVIGRTRRLRAIRTLRGSARNTGRRHLQAHQDLVSALRRRDPDQVEHVVRTHLLSSLSVLLLADGTG